MGYYINQINGKQLPARGKVKSLLAEGAITTDSSFKDNLICVVDNGPFEAAAYCYSQNERDAFAYPDGRPKTWLIVDNAKEIAT